MLSRASLATANQRKLELNKLITHTSTNVTLLRQDTTLLETNIKVDIEKATAKTIGKATTHLQNQNNTLLQKMEDIFAENIQLMADEKNDHNVDASVQQERTRNLKLATTEQLLKEMKDSTVISDAAQNIIV